MPEYSSDLPATQSDQKRIPLGHKTKIWMKRSILLQVIKEFKTLCKFSILNFYFIC